MKGDWKMNESGRILDAYKTIKSSLFSVPRKRAKMLVGNYIIEQLDENGNLELVVVSVPDEIS
jgi:hypothetical protein